MSPEEKDATVDAIRRLPQPTWADDPDHSLKRRQRQWLSAIVGKGHAAVDTWDQELAADAAICGRTRTSTRPVFRTCSDQAAWATTHQRPSASGASQVTTSPQIRRNGF
jgi:hypothetical protein